MEQNAETSYPLKRKEKILRLIDSLIPPNVSRTSVKAETETGGQVTDPDAMQLSWTGLGRGQRPSNVYAPTKVIRSISPKRKTALGSISSVKKCDKEKTNLQSATEFYLVSLTEYKNNLETRAARLSEKIDSRDREIVKLRQIIDTQSLEINELYETPDNSNMSASPGSNIASETCDESRTNDSLNPIASISGATDASEQLLAEWDEIKGSVIDAKNNQIARRELLKESQLQLAAIDGMLKKTSDLLVDVSNYKLHAQEQDDQLTEAMKQSKNVENVTICEARIEAARDIFETPTQFWKDSLSALRAQKEKILSSQVDVENEIGKTDAFLGNIKKHAQSIRSEMISLGEAISVLNQNIVKFHKEEDVIF